jgi:hypothetical protein
MASYALMASLSGFRYSAVEKTLWFGPRLALDPFQTFFSVASGFGTIRLSGSTLTVSLVEGELSLENLVFTRDEVTQDIPWRVTVRAGTPVEKELGPWV